MIHRRDVLMRQIMDLAQFLAEVLDLQQSEQYDEAAAHIEQAFRQLTGEQDPLRHYPIEKVIDQCSATGGRFSAELALNVADLLKQEGDLLQRDQRREEACRAYVRALILYKKAIATDTSALPLDIWEKVSDVEELTEPCDLTEDEQAALKAVDSNTNGS